MTPAPQPTSRAELVEALTVERFASPVPEYQPPPPLPGRETGDEAVLRRLALDLALPHDDGPDGDGTHPNDTGEAGSYEGASAYVGSGATCGEVAA